MPAYNNRAEQLAGVARRMRPDALPYYLHRARSDAEPAPGWYWRPAGAAHPHYLGANYLTAYVKLDALVREHPPRGEAA
jgi:hypothetical protein